MLRKIARLVIVVCLVFGVGTIKMGCKCKCVGDSVHCDTYFDTNATCTVTNPAYAPVCAGCQTIYTSPLPNTYYQKCVTTGVGFADGDPCDTCEPDCREDCGQKWVSNVICSEKPADIDSCVTACLYRRG